MRVDPRDSDVEIIRKGAFEVSSTQLLRASGLREGTRGVIQGGNIWTSLGCRNYVKCEIRFVESSEGG
jgi:hypothetical protein